jgi:hypothetical protein
MTKVRETWNLLGKVFNKSRVGACAEIMSRLVLNTMKSKFFQIDFSLLFITKITFFNNLPIYITLNLPHSPSKLSSVANGSNFFFFTFCTCDFYRFSVSLRNILVWDTIFVVAGFCAIVLEGVSIFVQKQTRHMCLFNMKNRIITRIVKALTKLTSWFMAGSHAMEIK